MIARVRAALLWILSVIGGLVILVTVLPLLQANVGLIRIWDFPRLQLAGLGAAVAAGLLALAAWRQWWSLVLLLGLVAAVAYQFVRILPYTPLVAPDSKLAGDPPAERCVSVLSANVYQENREKQALLNLIDRYDPDMLLVLETDDWWQDALRPVAETYPLVRSAIQSDFYGLMFMTRLKGSASVRYLVEDDKPSIKAALELPSGRGFTFYGLHPEPPRFRQSTDERDAALIVVARELRKEAGPAIIAGDLNDVGWSHTTRLFRQISRMIDPRIGRGLYASFHADYPLLRWPLDHLFHSDDFLLSRLEILPHIGSDHFPVFGRFCFSARAETRNEEPGQAGPSDKEEAQDAIQEGFEGEQRE